MLQSHCIYDYAELTETCTFSLITLNDLFKTYDKEITGILTTSSKTFISTFAVGIILTFTRFPNILEKPEIADNNYDDDDDDDDDDINDNR